MADVTLKHVQKCYPNGIIAVSDLSLEVADGEFLVLVGPSGCGKSTLLRLVAGLETPTAGEIYIGGRDVSGVAPAGRDIAMVFQDYSLYPHMNVYKNIALGLGARGLSNAEIERRVGEAAGMAGISDLLRRSPRELSGGQNQRVALARALVRDTAVFLLDEPLSDLDASMRAELRGEIAALHKKLGATFIYVTHDQTEAFAMGSRVAVMRGGGIEQLGSPGEVYQNPVNTFVAGFIGQGMNLLEVSVTRGKAAVCGVSLALSRPDGGVTLGFRPEHIEVSDGGEGISGEVAYSELIGPAIYLHVRCGGEKLVAVAPPGRAYPPGSAVVLRPDMAEARVFNRETGERMT